MVPPTPHEQFRRLVEKVFSAKAEKIDDQLDFDHKYQRRFRIEYESIIKIIVAAKDTDALDPLMKAYLALYEQYRQNKNNVHFYRSDQVFRLLVEQSGRAAIGEMDLFPVYAASIESGQPSPSLRQRFLELSPTAQSEVKAVLKAEKEKRRAGKSILDLLQDAYRKQHGFAAKKDADLYAFDPYPNQTFRLVCDRRVQAAANAWSVCLRDYKKENLEALNQSLDAFRRHAAVAARDNSMKLFQIVKYLQDVLTDRREGGYAMNEGKPATKVIPGDKNPLTIELYSIACTQLIVHAAVDKALIKNKVGFTPEEKKYFFSLIDGYSYASNVLVRFNVGLSRINVLFDQSKYFLHLVLITKHHLPGMHLVDIKEILKVQAFWKPIFELIELVEHANPTDQARILGDSKNQPVLEKLRAMAAINVGTEQNVPVPDLAKGTLSIRDSPGSHSIYGKIHIVYVNPRDHNEIYIELELLKPQLFRVSNKYLQDKQYGTRILDIHKGGVGMLYVTQFQMLAVMFLPVLIEAGFAGLIYEVGLFFASTKMEQAVSSIDPTAGKVVGLVAEAIAPRPKFKPGVIAPAAERAAAVVVLDAASTRGHRSFSEILASNRDEGALAADFNRSTAAKAKDKIADKVLALPSREGIMGRLEKLAESVRAPEPLLDRGLTLRTEGGSRSTGGTGTGGAPAKLGDSRLAKSEKLRQIEDYYPLLTKEEALLAKKEVNAAFADLNRGVISYSQASQRLTNVLNGAKEVTGEYVADGVIYGNYKVISEVAIPRRKNGVPMLDKVYKVKNPDTGSVEFLLVEVKGGEATSLGKVTAKKYEPGGGTINVTLDPSRMVKQGTGEWFYQKMVEIFQAEAIAGNRAAALAMQREFKKLAREMFASARRGNIKTAIVKSGRKLDPYVTDTTADTVNFFGNLESPFP